MENRYLFRAFNKKTKQLCDVWLIDFVNQCVTAVVDPERANQEDWKLSDIELMQFTGLSDRKGVKIFEGDRVKIDDWSITFDIVWNESKACFCPQKIESDLGRKMDYIPVQKTEVIGNIHEI